MSDLYCFVRLIVELVVFFSWSEQEGALKSCLQSDKSSFDASVEAEMLKKHREVNSWTVA